MEMYAIKIERSKTDAIAPKMSFDDVAGAFEALGEIVDTKHPAGEHHVGISCMAQYGDMDVEHLEV